MQNQFIEIAEIKQAIKFLQRAVAGRDPIEKQLTDFVQQYLTTELAGRDMSTEEIWEIFLVQVEAGYLRPLRYAKFCRALPRAMLSVFNVHRSTNLRRGKRRVRGYLGISPSVPMKLTPPDI